MTMKRRVKSQPIRSSGPGSPTSKADHAYAMILQSIQNGDYDPGDRLVIERLARELGVSVVPVREAIRRLEADGFVAFTRNVGATVASIDLERYPETIEAVAALEGIAIGLAAPHLTSAALANARAVNERMRAELETFDPVQFTRLNRRFHELLYGACPNRHILSLLEREWALLDTTRRTTFGLIPERAARSVDEHEELLARIERGDSPESIEHFAREHRMATARRVLQHVAGALASADGGGDALGELR